MICAILTPPFLIFYLYRVVRTVLAYFSSGFSFDLRPRRSNRTSPYSPPSTPDTQRNLELVRSLSPGKLPVRIDDYGRDLIVAHCIANLSVNSTGATPLYSSINRPPAYPLKA